MDLYKGRHRGNTNEAQDLSDSLQFEALSKV
jgi:hypothetical protein